MSNNPIDLASASRMINYRRFNSALQEWQKSYSTADPFPHIVIDNFLAAPVFEALVEQMPTGAQEMRRKPRSAALDDGRPAQLGKRNFAEGEVEPLLQLLFWQLNSGTFLSWLERLTGIKKLIADPQLRGAGIHMTERGGLLRVHADFNRHPMYDLDRRINFLLYMTPDWREEYGGHLELWDRDVTECRQRLLPVANRCVIFSTSSTSFHGHPEALTCPDGVYRRSLAMYYYTNGRPVEEQQEQHATLWPNLPGE